MEATNEVRRPGYASRNAAVARRGLHTRQRILECAGRLFVTHGYHGASIDAITKEVGGSRAAIYQYFENKEHILRERIAQCEPVVLDHAQRLGHLGPDVAGLRNLHQWLVEWAHMYVTYAIVFAELPGVGATEEPQQASGPTISDRYTTILSAKLRDAGVGGIDPDDAAAVLIRVVQMVHLYRFRDMFGLRSSEHMSASLAIAMQLLLFPETPADVLETVAIGAVPSTPDQVASAPIEHVATEGNQRPPSSPVWEDILSAASALFAERGYHAVTIPHIAAAAQTSRATAYRYFTSKVDILAELTKRGVTQAQLFANELRTLADSDLDAGQLRDWLTRYVAFLRAHSGVIRAWYDGSLGRQLSDHGLTEGVAAFQAAVARLVDRVRLPPGIDSTVATAVTLAVFGRVTELCATHRPVRSDADTAALILTVLQRMLLADTFSPAL